MSLGYTLLAPQKGSIFGANRVGFPYFDSAKIRRDFIETGGINMRVGYVRVSTVGQNTARQEVLMEELGAERV